MGLFSTETKCAFLLLLCLLLLHLDVILAHKIAPLTPPPGNSVQLKARSLGGYQLYRCADGDWLLESTYAVLVDVIHTGQVLGNYSCVQRPRQPKYAGTWALLNDGGDTAESGSSVSLVAGNKIASTSAGSGNLPNFLAEASMHQFTGTASLISYIAVVGTKGGLPPSGGFCDGQMAVKVPYQAEYVFWIQDLVPPSVPQSLALPTDMPVQGFYGKGVVSYVFNGKGWTQKSFLAQLYDLPGGSLMGSFYVMSKPDRKGGSYCWQINNPNGFQIVGKNACNPVEVSPDCLPWSLMNVTTYSGNMLPLGPFTHVQMVSTMGGLPPTSLPFKLTAGQLWKQPFSSIFWVYCSS